MMARAAFMVVLALLVSDAAAECLDHGNGCVTCCAPGSCRTNCFGMEVKCCDPAKKILAECRVGCQCCGTTGEWVASWEDHRVYKTTCSGITQIGPYYTAPFDQACETSCRMPNGQTVLEGGSAWDRGCRYKCVGGSLSLMYCLELREETIVKPTTVNKL